MNKELIKKYKAEFEYWLNGGEVLYFYWEDWFSSTFNQKIIFNHPNPDDVKYYIINDEFVEIRKALAEGKTIQFNFGNFGVNKEDFLNVWKDLNLHIGILADRTTPKNYRVKPEEPKFQVGDWIVNSRFPKLPFQVSKDWLAHIINTGRTIGGNTKETGDLKNFSLWQPKKGDWCWFWNEGTTLTILELLEIVDDGNRKYFAAMPNATHSLGGYYQYCEPFIGNLPTLSNK